MLAEMLVSRDKKGIPETGMPVEFLTSLRSRRYAPGGFSCFFFSSSSFFCCGVCLGCGCAGGCAGFASAGGGVRCD